MPWTKLATYHFWSHMRYLHHWLIGLLCKLCSRRGSHSGDLLTYESLLLLVVKHGGRKMRPVQIFACVFQNLITFGTHKRQLITKCCLKIQYGWDMWSWTRGIVTSIKSWKCSQCCFLNTSIKCHCDNICAILAKYTKKCISHYLHICIHTYIYIY